MKKGTIKPKKTIIDGELLWRIIHCDNCSKNTQHIYCDLKYQPKQGYVCFICGQERDRRKQKRRGL